MNEFLRYIEMIKKAIDIDYEKERVFYDSGEWYDRNECRNISLDELESILEGIAIGLQGQYEVNMQLQNKIYEILGDEEGDKVLDEIFTSVNG